MQKIKLLFILSASAFLLFYKLDKIPNGFYVDEAVSGYNSYSLLLTGKDEYGKNFPIAMRFFGSYSPPLYVYFSTIPVYFFGLSVFAIRSVSALAGVICVILIYFLSNKLKITSDKNRLLLFTFLFAISPWLIFYARSGYETFFGFFIYFIGLIYAYLALKKNKYIIPAAFFLSLSAYGSYPQRFLLPIWIAVYLAIFYKELEIIKNIKLFIGAFVIFIIIQIPNLLIINSTAFISKNSLFYIKAIKARGFFPLGFFYEFGAHYLSYLSPKSLFFLSDPDPQRSIPELSVFYVWQFIPYLVGLYVAFKNHKKINYRYILFLLLVSPIPAALTNEPFSTQRSLSVFVPVFLIICIGLNRFLSYKKIIIKITVFSLIFIYSPLMLYRSYFVLLPAERAVDWGYGYQQLTKIVVSSPNKNYVLDQTRSKPSYIEYAFFSKFSPIKMQQNYGKDFIKNYYNETQFSPPIKLNNIEFRNINWESDICKNQILIGDDLSFSENNIAEHYLQKEFEIKDPRGDIVFQGFQTHPELKCE